MKPVRMTHPTTGRLLGNILVVAEETGENPDTYTSYERGNKPLSNPAPKSVLRHPETGDKMYDIGEVLDWMALRMGRGNPGAPRTAKCPICHRPDTPVRFNGMFYAHRRYASEEPCTPVMAPPARPHANA